MNPRDILQSHPSLTQQQQASANPIFSFFMCACFVSFPRPRQAHACLAFPCLVLSCLLGSTSFFNFSPPPDFPEQGCRPPSSQSQRVELQASPPSGRRVFSFSGRRALKRSQASAVTAKSYSAICACSCTARTAQSHSSLAFLFLLGIATRLSELPREKKNKRRKRRCCSWPPAARI